MSFKIIIFITIIVSILIGAVIVKLINSKSQPSLTLNQGLSTAKNLINYNPPSKPSPSPKISKDSNLELEISNLTPEDFSPDFNSLRSEINAW